MEYGHLHVDSWHQVRSVAGSASGDARGSVARSASGDARGSVAGSASGDVRGSVELRVFVPLMNLSRAYSVERRRLRRFQRREFLRSS